MQICPITAQDCIDEASCRLVIRLEDYVGCPFDLAADALQDFKQTTVLPAAAKLDEKLRNGHNKLAKLVTDFLIKG